ncbi:Hypothetical protein R9X50_00195700 [Acrodontium crateriforme]|uniref:C2H2-type domain-containing protein n=1 Tax=Acrodontium crateriforme TaxID=150365 RepID=A0AAQ3M623_9PEZI|nr:Hypothetical protein R9X50_00195700 [Acrodontium crateriforme]
MADMMDSAFTLQHLPESHVRDEIAFATPAASLDALQLDHNANYTQYQPVNATLSSLSSLPSLPSLPSPDSTLSPAPSTRLAGEPAYCSGRHCCQWTVDGFICNNHYASAADLDRHVATEHAGRLPNGRPSGDYRCHWAGCSKSESFGNKPKLTRHLHSHTGHKPHPCLHPGCGKGFVTKEQLKNHETTHTKSKDHICPECGKGFAVKTALTSHMNVHRGAKPYICDECGKGFADSSNLSKHKAIHKRVSAKRHRHAHIHGHAHHAHTHFRSHHPPTSNCSATNICNPTSFSLGSISNSFEMPSNSIESNSLEPCLRPCYDVQCTSDTRIPCRSVSPPCSAEACATNACAEDCDDIFGPCNMAHAAGCDINLDPCSVQLCELAPCDFEGCDLQACMPGCEGLDCMEFCHHHAFCNDGSDVEDDACQASHCAQGPCVDFATDCGCPGVAMSSSTPSLVPQTSNSGSTSSQIQTPEYNFGHATGNMGMDEEGFKQLQEFLESSDFGTSTLPHDAYGHEPQQYSHTRFS